MRESTTFFRDGMRKLMKNPLAVASLIVLIILTLTIIIVPAVYMDFTLIYSGRSGC